MSNLDTLTELADEARALYNRLECLYWSRKPGMTQRLYNRWQRRAERLEEYEQDQRFNIEIDRVYEGEL